MGAATEPLPLAEVHPGMVLSEALCDAKGATLLGAGVVLTEAMLAALARHGIALLPILRARAAPALPDPHAVLARLDQLFRHGGQDERRSAAGATLRRHVERYRLNGSTGTAAAPGAAP